MHILLYIKMLPFHGIWALPAGGAANQPVRHVNRFHRSTESAASSLTLTFEDLARTNIFTDLV